MEGLELHVEVEGAAMLDRAETEMLVACALQAAGIGEGVVEVGVQWVAPDRIRELNRDHRDVDSATDVLSFPIDGVEELPPGIPRQLGDVVVCAEYVAGQVADGSTMVGDDAGRGGDEGLVAALRRCVVHGTLHLLGEDHGEEAAAARMFALEEDVLAAAAAGGGAS